MDKQVVNEYFPDYAVTPGEVLSHELELRGMTQQELAKRTGLTPKHIVYPCVGVGNVYRGRLDLSEIKQFELLEGDLERFRLVRGDILVVEGNGSANEIGRGAIWAGEIEDCVQPNHIIRCPAFLRELTHYVLRYLNSPNGIQLMKALAVTSSGLYSLSVGKIRTIMIPLPPFAEQQRIVAKVEDLMVMCDLLEAQIGNTAITSRQLLEAILHALPLKVPGYASELTSKRANLPSPMGVGDELPRSSI